MVLHHHFIIALITAGLLALAAACGGEDVPYDRSLIEDENPNLAATCPCASLNRIILTQECFEFCSSQEEAEEPAADVDADADTDETADAEGDADADSDTAGVEDGDGADAEGDDNPAEEDLAPTDVGDTTNVAEG